MQTTSSVRTFRSSRPEEPKKPKKPKKDWRLRQRTAVLFAKLKTVRTTWLLIAALVLLSIFLYAQYHQARHKLVANTPIAVKQQTQDVVAQVGKLIILPRGQTPTVATVVHAEKLRNQAFFSNAKDGDKVLVYSQTKQAILYRPSTNQLVNVSTVSAVPTTTTTL